MRLKAAQLSGARVVLLSNALCLNLPVSDGLGVQSERNGGRRIIEVSPISINCQMSVRIPPYHHNHQFTLQVIGGGYFGHIYFSRTRDVRALVYLWWFLKYIAS